MAKFHINKHGVPAPCRAKEGNCPLGGSSGNENHFDTLDEAQKHADKQNEEQYELIPDVSKETNETKASTKENKLTPTQERAQKKKAHDAEVTKRLNNYWKKRDGSPDEKMVKHCLKSSKYIQIGDAMVDIGDAKPSINSEMWYDDETEGPQVNFENFRAYNTHNNLPKSYEMRGRNRDGMGTLKIIPQYDGVNGLELATLTYEDNVGDEYIEVSEAQLKEINEGIDEIKADYEKRLTSYYKRYGDKIMARGYWKNR